MVSKMNRAKFTMTDRKGVELKSVEIEAATTAELYAKRAQLLEEWKAKYPANPSNYFFLNRWGFEGESIMVEK